ncbi:MAG: adenylate/guanylate cyclase domain-containing protein [Pseudomonadota bacterium]
MSAPAPRWRLRETLDWLVMEGRFAPDFDAFVEQVGLRLVADGAPIYRFRIGFRTLHPLVTAVTGIWERDEAQVQHLEAEHGLERRGSYVGSPMAQIAEGDEPLRIRLDQDIDPEAHYTLRNLKAQGATDYFGCKLPFATDGAGIMVLTSDEPGGFTDGELADFETLAAALTPMVEIERLKRISNAVAEAYLGPRTGQRVLGGRITRGDVETIDAAIMISDLRNWTGISASLSPEDAIALANRYFDLMSAAVEAEGGEILKFMGDGVLAIFAEQSEAADPCERALAAARAALVAGDEAGLRFGFGLHVGEVLYGNIGSEARLDFTVLGGAVNVAARIEALCSKLGRPLLYSADFAARLSNPGEIAAEELLKGLSEPTTIYGPAP